jgi:DNA repair exonuclease SbcCD ATPase subunit
MLKKRSEAKGKLMQEAETIIDELLAWEEEIEEPDLSQIEEKVLELRQRLSEKMAETVIEGQTRIRPGPGPECGVCGQEMRYKGPHSKRVTSWVGELELKRGYYYCEGCRRGYFPPG